MTQPTATSIFSSGDMGTAASDGRASTEGVGAGVAHKTTTAGCKIKAVSFE